jgi:sulfoxide reductase heme-binding subunit YedZ
LDTDLPAGYASVMPLRRLTDQLWLIRFRRMFGLFSFFYVSLLFLTYIWRDKFFDVHELLVDIAKRKFITLGFTGFVLLIPLAFNSTSGIRRLDGCRWNRLHQLIYLAAIAGVIHYYWLVKAEVRKPLQYAVVLSLLLGYRLVISVFRNPRQTTMPDSRARACKSLA